MVHKHVKCSMSMVTIKMKIKIGENFVCTCWGHYKRLEKTQQTHMVGREASGILQHSGRVETAPHL